MAYSLIFAMLLTRTFIKRDGGELRWSMWMFGVLMTLTMIPEQSRKKTRLTIIQP